MNNLHFTQEQLAKVARLSDEDMTLINNCRGEHNKLGCGYQLCYVKLFNRLPVQGSFTPVEELATFVAVQLDLPVELLSRYAAQKANFFRHQEDICAYLGVGRYDQTAAAQLRDYVFQQAQQIQAIESLAVKAMEFLREKKVLNPSDSTLGRLIQSQREKARVAVFERIGGAITPELMRAFDDLLVVETQYSKLHQIKEAPRKPSAEGMKLLADKLTLIEQTGVMSLDLGWLNNNYKRYLSTYITRCDANKVRELAPTRRYAALICFLEEAHQNTTDHIFDMYQKALNG